MNPDEKVVADVAEFGWHVIKVAADGTGPAFAFTIGLTKTFGHPEVIVFGLALDAMHSVLNNIGKLVREGRQFAHDVVTDELLEDYPCHFLHVPRSAYREFLGYAIWFYKGDTFDTVQCVWPDREGRYPWDAGVVEQVRRLQPLLGAR
ncbi:MAG: DUF4262 domain-containing protein [Myxococcales bacterium]|nr:DUF4262 domain-containing protein [Myxococcales bacterium]